jgi:alginate O-acetyltransferase complex protein AlgI
MVFSSPIFLFLFLPIVLCAYFLIRDDGRNLLLLLASVAFYMWGEGTYVLVMAIMIGVNYAFGVLLERLHGRRLSRAALILAVAINLGMLIIFKYANFLVDNVNALMASLGGPGVVLAPIHLPLGISFFVFHAISYVIDVSRRNVRAGGPANFSLYMMLFPHAIAGPIVRYGDIAEQLRDRTVTTAGFSEGARRFILGLSKKMLVANTLAQAGDAVFKLPTSDLTFALSWLGVACYTLQIYFDFSGYSDMAIGLARLFGIDFRENFDHPYVARSMTDFWRRWHISLSTWFRDYVYIPLGGNRRGPVRLYANLFVVFALCGMWHGASWNFLAWGLFHGGLLAVERVGLGRRLQGLWAPLQHAYTWLAVMVGWVFFRAESIPQATAFLGAMVGLGRGTGVVYHPSLYIDSLLVLALIAGVVGSMPVLPWLAGVRDRLLASPGGVARSVMRAGFPVANIVVLSFLLLASSLFLATGTYNPFIYFRF